ncbi:MAG: homoprotocatechuate degradation operon regulator HpaR [Hyphomicrobiales bacterium]
MLSKNAEYHKNTQLRDTQRSLPIALLRAREIVMSRFRPVLKKHKITEQQWRVLRVLTETGAIDATKIAEKSCILAPSLTRIIRTLEQRGLIKREKNRIDARKLVLSITLQGTALVEKVAPESSGIYDQLEAEYGVKKTERLLDSLEELSKLK